MYKPKDSPLPRKPVIPSALSAHQEFNRWVAANAVHEITDKDGDTWQVEYRQEVQAPAGTPDTHWQVTVLLSCELYGAHLQKTGILQAPADNRVLTLLGQETVPMAMRPHTIQGPNLEEVTKLVHAHLENMRHKLAYEDLRDIKRQLACRWLDESRLFGASAIPAEPKRSSGKS